MYTLFGEACAYFSSLLSFVVALCCYVCDILLDVHARCAAGNYHSVLLASNGEVFTCGEAAYGALGCGNCENSSTLRRVSKLLCVGIVQVSCGEHHTAALSIDGKTFMWGRGKYGQLGLGSTENVNTPQLVDVNGVEGKQVHVIRLAKKDPTNPHSCCYVFPGTKTAKYSRC